MVECLSKETMRHIDDDGDDNDHDEDMMIMMMMVAMRVISYSSERRFSG